MKVTLVLSFLFVHIVCQDDIELIEQFIQEVMEVESVPGLCIAVVKDGQPYLVKGFGVKNMYEEDPVDENTLFYIASTGKAMTGALVAKVLAQENSLDLDSPVKPILGEDFYLSEYYSTINVNSRDLMAHRVNIPASEFHWMLGEITDREELIRRSRFWEATTSFRNDFRYSNVMTTVAGVVAGKLLNKTWEEAMRSELFYPLEMFNTSYLHELTDAELERLVTPHHTNFVTGRTDIVSMDAYSTTEATAPSGGIVSSAADLAKWLQFQTNNGQGPSGDIVLDSDVLEETRIPHIMLYTPSLDSYKPLAPVTYVEDTYGFGWGLGTYRGYRTMQHGGALYGFWATNMILPDMKAGIYICANGPDGSRSGNAMRRIKLYTMDILLGEEPWVNSTYPFNQNSLFHSESDSQFEISLLNEYERNSNIEKTTLNRNALADYEGLFGHFAMGNISVIYNGTLDRLTAYFGTIGIFNLVLINDTDPLIHEFLAVAQEPFWFLPPVRTTFYMNEETGQAVGMEVPIMLPEDPPLLERDLDFADAPDPPTDNCPSNVHLYDNIHHV